MMRMTKVPKAPTIQRRMKTRPILPRSDVAGGLKGSHCSDLAQLYIKDRDRKSVV